MEIEIGFMVAHMNSMFDSLIKLTAGDQWTDQTYSTDDSSSESDRQIQIQYKYKYKYKYKIMCGETSEYILETAAYHLVSMSGLIQNIHQLCL